MSVGAAVSISLLVCLDGPGVSHRFSLVVIGMSHQVGLSSSGYNVCLWGEIYWSIFLVLWENYGAQFIFGGKSKYLESKELAELSFFQHTPVALLGTGPNCLIGHEWVSRP